MLVAAGAERLRAPGHAGPRRDRPVRVRHLAHLLILQEELKEAPGGVAVGRVDGDAPLPRPHARHRAAAEVRQRHDGEVVREGIAVGGIQPVADPRDRAAPLDERSVVGVRSTSPSRSQRWMIVSASTASDPFRTPSPRGTATVDQVAARRPHCGREAIRRPFRRGGDVVELEVQRPAVAGAPESVQDVGELGGGPGVVRAGGDAGSDRAGSTGGRRARGRSRTSPDPRAGRRRSPAGGSTATGRPAANGGTQESSGLSLPDQA